MAVPIVIEAPADAGLLDDAALEALEMVLRQDRAGEAEVAAVLRTIRQTATGFRRWS